MKKKAEALTKDGHLACEVCAFDFALTYGEEGEGVIEVHTGSPSRSWDRR